MPTKVEATVEQVRSLAQLHERVAVAFSGGKDSLATLDIACRFFRNVSAFYWYWVPGLQCDEARLKVAKDRWGIDVLLYPHPVALQAFQTCTFCDPIPELHAMPTIERRDLFDAVKADTKASIIFTGEKKADGFWRRRRIAARKHKEADVILPLKDWTRWEVLNYCKANGLPVIEGGSSDNSGVNLSTEEILHLHDEWPEDYALMKSYFPYIEAIIVRRELYGLSHD